MQWCPDAARAIAQGGWQCTTLSTSARARRISVCSGYSKGGKESSQRGALKIDEDYVVFGNFVKSPAACL